MLADHGIADRRTVSPTRTTSALELPPLRGCSGGSRSIVVLRVRRHWRRSPEMLVRVRKFFSSASIFLA